MKYELKFDDFYVSTEKSGQKLSVIGIRFIAELITESLKKINIDPRQVAIRIGSEYSYESVSIAYPHPDYTIIKDIKIDNEKLKFFRRGEYKWDTRRNKLSNELLLSDPNLIDKFAIIIKDTLKSNKSFLKK